MGYALRVESSLITCLNGELVKDSSRRLRRLALMESSLIKMRTHMRRHFHVAKRPSDTA